MNRAALVFLLAALALVAITTVYVYFDRRIAHELAGDVEEAVLPAEIEVAG